MASTHRHPISSLSSATVDVELVVLRATTGTVRSPPLLPGWQDTTLGSLSLYHLCHRRLRHAAGTGTCLPRLSH
ncbi:hypothetical protein E2562_038734 [Oryza meyeriana var. granulata]|uniref:Uncharacterized protein n=1 Tax=Oryza meyeriana var. granulata TaxID=110450 RepID=A0A6G1CWF8_9ORYZ|nr:hypothetical protein E2562_038734 [Oryza meyeriana var. granulata]